MMEAAGHGRLDDLAFVKALHPSWLRSVLREGEVGPGTVVVEEVVTQQAAQMGFVRTTTWSRHSRRRVPMRRST
jgi:hypothetical protein